MTPGSTFLFFLFFCETPAYYVGVFLLKKSYNQKVITNIKDMGLFWTNTKPRITKEEFKKIRSELSSQDFTMKERDRVEEIFRGDLFEIKEIDKGIDEPEINTAISWMKDNVSKHNISLRKIEILERKLKAKL